MGVIKFSTECFRNHLLTQGFTKNGSVAGSLNGYGDTGGGNQRIVFVICKGSVPTKSEVYGQNRDFRSGDRLISYNYNGNAYVVVGSSDPAIELVTPTVLTATASQSGVATWFGGYTLGGFSLSSHPWFICSITATGGGGDMQVADVNVVSGESYDLTPTSFTFPTVYTY